MIVEADMTSQKGVRFAMRQLLRKTLINSFAMHLKYEENTRL